jgi:gamma-resorcylate decarboxylase
MNGKIAVEEHFVTPDLEWCIASVGWDAAAWRRVLDRLIDVEGERLEQMDRYGIDVAVLSLGAFGIQSVTETAEAVRAARRANDALAEVVHRRSDRFTGLAAVAMQDPQAAADELERSVRELGLKGALINGYSDGDGTGPTYYDGPAHRVVWERAAALGVPVYLHPRNPLPDTPMFAGRPELLGPTWGFAVETGTHALRLVTSGLFDELPELTIVLGHLGEFLPFAMARLEQRIAHVESVSLRTPPRQVLRENFYVTTSGNSHTPSLLGTMLEVGADRVLFAADYPFEEMGDGAEWFDAVPISEADRLKIGRTNAERLFGLSKD